MNGLIVFMAKRPPRHEPKYCGDTTPGQRYDQSRKSAAARGYDHRWRKIRRAHLNKYPLCAECKRNGIVRLANEVDHIRPHRGNIDLFFDMDNLQSLCKSCHSSKTAKGY